MICAVPCCNVISHMESADICSLPEGKYSRGSILQALLKLAGVTAAAFMK